MVNLKEEILSATNSGLSVFEYYIPKLKKNGTGKNFRAVFREDGQNPDARVFFNNKSHSWCYHDYVSDETLSPFDFVMKRQSCDFSKALEIINKELLHGRISTQRDMPKVPIDHCNFSLIAGNDFRYWFDFGPEENMKSILNRYNVKSLSSYNFNKGGKCHKVIAGEDDPIFAFSISESSHKIYRPHAKGKQVKHLWLGKKPEGYNNLYGLEQLPDFSEYILIVEGLKDTIVANANCIIAVGVDNASTKIPESVIEGLRKKCNHLLVCYDIDEPGLKASEKIAAQHHLKGLILTDSLKEEGGKDISDFFRLGHQAYEILTLAQLAIESEETCTEIKEDVPKVKTKRLSKFEKIEELITENFDLRFNEVSNEIEYRSKDSENDNYQLLNENNIYRFLQHSNIEFSMAKLTSLLRSDFVPRFNPFISYFEQLKPWTKDNDTDYIADLCKYIPAKEQERFSIQFRKALVRTIACALTDSIINKQALILVQEEQNSGKSTFIRWLCPPVLHNYIAENISTDKDSLIALSDNLIINMDELATLSRAEINSLKSMFSKETIKIRRPYDKTASSAPRRASFFGSTNKTEFLTDETGSVRWLCFELTDRINWDYKKDIDINNIWRQSYHLYKSGYKYELSLDEIRDNEFTNQQYQVTTPEIELIQKYYLPGTKENNDGFFQATDFLNILSESRPNTRLNIINIGKALKLLGFERTCQRNDSYPVKGYYIRNAEMINNP